MEEENKKRPQSPIQNLLEMEGHRKQYSINIKSSQMFFKETPSAILIVHKPTNDTLQSTAFISKMMEFCVEKGISVFSATHIAPNLGVREWTGMEPIDFIVSMGGDGTVLHAAWLFQRQVPPIITIHYGTLGFLNTFVVGDEWSMIWKTIVGDHCNLNLRMRLACSIIKGDSYYEKSVIAGDCGIKERGGEGDTFHVLNEAVISGDKGKMCKFDIYVDGQLVSEGVEADGLIIATPTGSTAYNLSAGGSIAHPQSSIILLTPICPHSLSFRPLLLPDTAQIMIKSRGDSVQVSFDGKLRMDLSSGMMLVVESSQYSVATVSRDCSGHDWFNSLATCLHWNKSTGRH